MIEKKEKEVIGRLERISLPEFNIYNVEAKIDTGAYNGSIHVSNIEEIMDGDVLILKFTLLDEEHPEYNGKVFETRSFQKKVVRNSSGSTDVRYLIPVRLILKNREFDVKLGLSNRKDMRYPVLIGRKIIKKHFVIDAARKFTKNK